jgi:hypothetical protein
VEELEVSEPVDLDILSSGLFDFLVPTGREDVVHFVLTDVPIPVDTVEESEYRSNVSAGERH